MPFCRSKLQRAALHPEVSANLRSVALVSTWSQLHICDLDRKVIDLKWQIAHSVLYTGARLAHRFGMHHIESLCFCQADDETLNHLFFNASWLAFWLLGYTSTYIPSIQPLVGLLLRSCCLCFWKHVVEQFLQSSFTCCWL